MKKYIYLDHAAATPIDSSVKAVMREAMNHEGNPSSYNDAGRVAADLLSQARTSVARFLEAHSDEIIFTSSGSEANALALHGSTKANKIGTIVTIPIEHISVLENAKATGCKIIWCNVDSEGRVSLSEVARHLKNTPMIISIMYANNEIGTIEPITQIGKMIRAFRKEHTSIFPLFHVDACQASAYLPMNVDQLGVDLLTMNGSKVYGPRGVGVLYVRRGVTLSPMISGGGQENGRRAGTENLPAIAGLAQALANLDPAQGDRISKLRDYFFDRITKAIPEARINGALGSERLANNINISIPNLDSENLLLELDKSSIRAGSGAACTARSVEPSHVLTAIGVKRPYLDGALRFSLGKSTQKKDIEYLLKVLPKTVAVLKKRYSL